MKFYHLTKNALVYIKSNANAEYWSNLWLNEIEDLKYQFSIKENYVSYFTEKYIIDKKGKILEGGCGLGRHVNLLQRKGYDVIGLDFSFDTVKFLNTNFSELNIVFGDVRNLKYPSNYFNGYWSLGVIEHFWNGFDDISSEMERVLNKGGYLFLAFPSLSPLRKLKIKLGLFPNIEVENEMKDFYQFALDKSSVKIKIESLGFKFMEDFNIYNSHGLIDELPAFKFLFRLIDIKYSKLFISKLIRVLIRYLFKNFAYHSSLLIYKKF